MFGRSVNYFGEGSFGRSGLVHFLRERSFWEDRSFWRGGGGRVHFFEGAEGTVLLLLVQRDVPFCVGREEGSHFLLMVGGGFHSVVKRAPF